MNEMQPYISICIPAYKQAGMVRRLLDSIVSQSFKNFEVIITDDSADNAIALLSAEYSNLLPLTYFHNTIPLGTPENWNQAIRLAKGKWIKLMHQDDWFVDNNVLKKFYEYSVSYPDIRFFFSAFANHDLEKKNIDEVRCNWFQLLLLRLSPLHLFKKVYVGNPSCTMIRRDVELMYDRRLKFVVDFEYYIRCFQSGTRWKYIDDCLIHVGFHPNQVTKSTFLVPEVQIPENNLLINSFSSRILNNLFVFDYYWRMFRNLSIRSFHQAKSFDIHPMPESLVRILKYQFMYPLSILKIGLFSKLLMLISYVRFQLGKN